MTVQHHQNLREDLPGVWRPLQPARDTSWWHRWKRERACRKTLGHCWHPHGFVDWFCCSCGGETEGHPPQKCVHCLADRPTAGSMSA